MLSRLDVLIRASIGIVALVVSGTLFSFFGFASNTKPHAASSSKCEASTELPSEYGFDSNLVPEIQLDILRRIEEQFPQAEPKVIDADPGVFVQSEILDAFEVFVLNKDFVAKAIKEETTFDFIIPAIGEQKNQILLTNGNHRVFGIPKVFAAGEMKFLMRDGRFVLQFRPQSGTFSPKMRSSFWLFRRLWNLGIVPDSIELFYVGVYEEPEITLRDRVPEWELKYLDNWVRREERR